MHCRSIDTFHVFISSCKVCFLCLLREFQFLESTRAFGCALIRSRALNPTHISEKIIFTYHTLFQNQIVKFSRFQAKLKQQRPIPYVKTVGKKEMVKLCTLFQRQNCQNLYYNLYFR